jgi:hypothetical protein
LGVWEIRCFWFKFFWPQPPRIKAWDASHYIMDIIISPWLYIARSSHSINTPSQERWPASTLSIIQLPYAKKCI